MFKDLLKKLKINGIALVNKIKEGINKFSLNITKKFEKMANTIDDIKYTPTGDTLDDLIYSSDSAIEELREKLEDTIQDKEFYKKIVADLLKEKVKEKTELSNSALALQGTNVDKNITNYLDVLVEAKKQEICTLNSRKEYFSGLTEREKFLISKIQELETFKNTCIQKQLIINM